MAPPPSSPRAGHWQRQQAGPESFAAFIPAPLPPEPPVDLGGELGMRLEEASHALGRLEGVSAAIDPGHLLHVYVRKEAVLSSQIEGTSSTLTDLLQYEAEGAPGVPLDDVREVSRYVAALHHGIDRMRGAMPLCLRLIREMHGVLMAEGRGSEQTPGEFRRTQNWIGGTRPGTARFVPPPVPDMLAALDNLERFLNDEPARAAAPLVKAGLAHAQFETIHPFLDGNGRVGRLLITCVLHAERVLTQPVLYLSLHFRQRRAEYYDALQRVRTDGDWEGWLAFYLEGVAAVAREAADTARALLALEARDRARVQGLGKGAASALAVFDLLRQRVVTSIARAAEATGLTIPTVTAALARLQALGIVRETTGKRYGRQFVYGAQLDLLDRGLGTTGLTATAPTGEAAAWGALDAASITIRGGSPSGTTARQRWRVTEYRQRFTVGPRSADAAVSGGAAAGRRPSAGARSSDGSSGPDAARRSGRSGRSATPTPSTSGRWCACGATTASCPRAASARATTSDGRTSPCGPMGARATRTRTDVRRASACGRTRRARRAPRRRARPTPAPARSTSGPP